MTKAPLYDKLYSMKPLNENQKLFCHEYLKDFNATQAATRAGYSAKTAYSQGQRLLKHVEAKKYMSMLIDEILGTQKEQVKLRVLKELQEIAFNDDEVKHSDQIKALELLGKYASLFQETVNHNHAVTIVDDVPGKTDG